MRADVVYVEHTWTTSLSTEKSAEQPKALEAGAHAFTPSSED